MLPCNTVKHPPCFNSGILLLTISYTCLDGMNNASSWDVDPRWDLECNASIFFCLFVFRQNEKKYLHFLGSGNPNEMLEKVMPSVTPGALLFLSTFHIFFFLFPFPCPLGFFTFFFFL